jgi:hypothetical protein
MPWTARWRASRWSAPSATRLAATSSEGGGKSRVWGQGMDVYVCGVPQMVPPPCPLRLAADGGICCGPAAQVAPGQSARLVPRLSAVEEEIEASRASAALWRGYAPVITCPPASHFDVITALLGPESACVQALMRTCPRNQPCPPPALPGPSRTAIEALDNQICD